MASGHRFLCNTSGCFSRNKRLSGRGLLLESLEPKLLLTVGPELISINPNSGDLLEDGQILNVAPMEFLLRFSEDQALDASTITDGVRILRSGQDGIFGNTNDVIIDPGFIGLLEVTDAAAMSNQVIVRFATDLVDDSYQVQVIGSGNNPLANVQGDPFNGGQDQTIFFELDLGAEIIAVVPQPIRRFGDELVQKRDEIVIYFNNDDLDQSSATNPDFYQLISTNADTGTTVYSVDNETVRNTDDGAPFRPTRITYDANADLAVLQFASNIDELLTTDSGTFRLRIGNDEAVPVPPLTQDIVVDPGSSFNSSLSLGILDSQGRVIHSSIDTQDYQLDFPGDNAEPGHRDLLIEQHIRDIIPDPLDRFSNRIPNKDFEPGVLTVAYTFRDIYGEDPSGNPLHNFITELQKERTREIFELYSQHVGTHFFEADEELLPDLLEAGIPFYSIVTGDMRAINPVVQTGPGGVLMESGVVIDDELGIIPTFIMDNAEIWDENFGDNWFHTAMNGVGHLMGMGTSLDLAPGTIGADFIDPNLPLPEPVFPGDHDLVHAKHLFRPDGRDIDLYRVEITQAGLFAAETFAERQLDASFLDTVLQVFQRDTSGDTVLVAQNNDYFSNDSFIELELDPGTYYVGVSASGNTNYDPAIPDSGLGGTTEGPYELRLNLRPRISNSITDTTGVALDGDADGNAGGVYNFWFRAQTPDNVLIVDKAPASNPTMPVGSLANPYESIRDAFAGANPGDVVRVVGNGGADRDLATLGDNSAYEVGFNAFGQTLNEGASLLIPKDVTMMVDAGALIKLRRGHIAVGSSASSVDRSGSTLQVLGTPTVPVYFTSVNDETRGVDTNSLPTTPAPGDWGGIIFQSDIDRLEGHFIYENEGIFLNYVNHADVRYGGGEVVIESVSQIVTPIQMVEARPTVSFNNITTGADAAISADPNSFEESNFHSSQYQTRFTGFFTSDYTRVGPDIHGNTLTDNSINGLFVRIRTPAGNKLRPMTVSGRWDDTDVVHVVSENLQVMGDPGGPLHRLVRKPNVSATTLTPLAGGTLEEGTYNYRIVFVAEDGTEQLASVPTVSAGVEGASGRASVLLEQLPRGELGTVSRRIYRSKASGTGPYVFVAETDTFNRKFLDTGATSAIELDEQKLELDATLDARLTIGPRTIVKLDGARIEATLGGQLVAEAVEGHEIIFTALEDDRFGAGINFDTNGDADDTVAEAGDWGGIFSGPASRLSIDHAVLTFGGGITRVEGSFAGFNVLEIAQSEARVTNSLFINNASGVGGQAPEDRFGRGFNTEATVFLRGAQPIFVGNVIRDNEGAALSTNVNGLNHFFVTDWGRTTGPADRITNFGDNQGPLIRQNRIGGNSTNGMVVRGGVTTTESVWDDTNVAHVVLDEIIIPDFHTFGGVRLESSSIASLIVKSEGENAGFTATGDPLENDDRIGGRLQIIGQPDFPVVLTSLDDDRVGAGVSPDGNVQNDTNGDGISDEDANEDDVVVNPGTGPLVITSTTATANELRDTLLGPGVTPVGNATLFGGSLSAGTFSGGGSSIQIPSGIVLSSGDVNIAAGPNTGNGDTGTASGVNDADLQAEFNIANEDSAYLEFDFETSGGDLFFNFVFASEEYNDFSNSTFNDVFAFFINGVNIAFIPGTNTPISINTINGGNPLGTTPINPQFFNNNDISDNGQFLTDFGMDGFTNVFTAQQLNLGPGVHTIKLAISDVGDQIVDSAVFLQSGSFSDEPVDPFSPGTPGAWRGIILDEYSHDRNVDVLVEREAPNQISPGSNATTSSAQFLGTLGPFEKGGDDNRRLGFDVQGFLNEVDDVDVYSFRADAGVEVWLDIDRTSQALDSVVELLDADGTVIARSDDSPAEENRIESLFGTALPLARSLFNVPDRYTTNPNDAGMRVILPGAFGTHNTYHVRVRSSSADVATSLANGLTKGNYHLQIRLQELDEIAGSTIQFADIRNAVNGIEIFGQPRHSPLLGEAGENEPNDLSIQAQELGNILTTDRGALSLAGNLSGPNDVDWYRFQVEFEDTRELARPTYAYVSFDMDYADGFAGPDTSLFIYEELEPNCPPDLIGLVYASDNSAHVDDLPADGASDGISDLSKGSGGVFDPYLGSVALEEGFYCMAVTTSAIEPVVLDDILIRAEPVISQERIGEDHIGFADGSNIPDGPTVPLVFTEDYVLFPDDLSKTPDGETFRITGTTGDSVTYEFDKDSTITAGHVAVLVNLDVVTDFGSSAFVEAAIRSAIQSAPPDGVTIGTSGTGTRFFVDGVPLQGVAGVSQVTAAGESDASLYVAKPSVVPFQLDDVVLFATQDSGLPLNRTRLITLDPFTGDLETIVGVFDGNVEDLAIQPDGSLYGFTVFEGDRDDGNTGNLIQIDSGGLITDALGNSVGDDGVNTFSADPANLGSSIDPDTEILINAHAFGELGGEYRGFFIANRSDTNVFGVQGPTTNLLYEFDVETGQAFSIDPPGNRTGADQLQGAGTDVVERGAFDTTVDPGGATNSALVTVDATVTDVSGNTVFQVTDGVTFDVNDGSGNVFTFEMNTGPEVTYNYDPAGGLFVLDGDTFSLDGINYEFDTGSVVIVTALNGNGISDGDTFTVTDNQVPSVTRTFEFDDSTGPPIGTGNITVSFNAGFDQAELVTAIVNSINAVPNFSVNAQAVPNSNRVSLFNESTSIGTITTSTGIQISGAPGGVGNLIPVEESFGFTQFGLAVDQAINGTPDASVSGSRINFSSATTGNFNQLAARGIFSQMVGSGGSVADDNIAVNFLATNSSAELAARITAAIAANTGLTANLGASSVVLQSSGFNNVEPPLGIGGSAPGGDFKGMVIVNGVIYAVTGQDRLGQGGGGLYRINGALGNGAQADYLETSTDLLTGGRDAAGNPTGDPINFTSLTGGLRNLRNGEFQNILLGLDESGNLYAFDTTGRLQPILAGGQPSIRTNTFGKLTGIAFSTLDVNLWHVTDRRFDDPGHGYEQAPDGSRQAETKAGNTSFHFGFDSPGLAPGDFTGLNDPGIVRNYQFPGGAHGSLVSNSFSLREYSEGAAPTLYFSYFIETEDADMTVTPRFMRDSFRVFVSGDDGVWQLAATNNQVRRAGEFDDEFDYSTLDVQELFETAVNPDDTDATDDTDDWRQAIVDLSPFAGHSDVRVRFDFSTAGELAVGDPNAAGDELRVPPASGLSDGETFTVFNAKTSETVTLEFDFGYVISLPAGASLVDSETLTVSDGHQTATFEFDAGDGVVNSRTPILFDQGQTPGEVALEVEKALEFVFGGAAIIADLNVESNDVISNAQVSGASRGTFTATGTIGDNPNLTGIQAGRDVDMLQVELLAGQTIAIDIDTTGVDGLSDSFLRIFNAAGVELATNNDAVAPDDLFLTAGDSYLIYAPPVDGSYFIGISSSPNTNYDPDVPVSGVIGGIGSYSVYLEITGNPQVINVVRSGSELNLVGAVDVSFSSNSAIHFTSLLGSHFNPVPVELLQSDDEVALRIREAFASSVGGTAHAYPGYNDVIRLPGFRVTDAGPLGITVDNPFDPDLTTTFFKRNGLEGDIFGAFNASTNFNGTEGAALRNRANDFEGAFIDDVIIGFANRGEMFTAVPVGGEFTTYEPDPDEPETRILEGDYQLEVRPSSRLGEGYPFPIPTLIQTRTIEPGQRLGQNVTLVLPSAADLVDGLTFAFGDGNRGVVFEYEDTRLDDGITPGSFEVPYDPTDSGQIIAQRVRDLINGNAFQQILDVTATWIPGTAKVALFGNVPVQETAFAPEVPVGESSDTLTTAVDSGILPDGRRQFRSLGQIGDNVLIGPGLDVDIISLQLEAAERITIDIDADERQTGLDSILRVFDSAGNELIFSDDDPAPGEASTRDPYIDFTVVSAGTYYVGVSGFANLGYDPNVVASGVSGSVGRYEIDISVGGGSRAGVQIILNDEVGDTNRFRDQGQIVIHSSRISDSLEFGIVVDAAPRSGPGNAPALGPPRVLNEINDERLTPGVTIKNNIINFNIEGAIHFSGDAAASDHNPAVPFGRIVNNTLVGGGQEVQLPMEATLSLDFSELDGLTGENDDNPAVSTVLVTELAPSGQIDLLTSITLSDSGEGDSGKTGAFTGFDLDAVVLSNVLVSDPALIPTLPTLDIFDFSPAGTALTLGTQQPVADPNGLFGTTGLFVDEMVATLDTFDGVSPFTDGMTGELTATGFVSLGDGGSVSFSFLNPVDLSEQPLYLYIGEVDDEDEVVVGPEVGTGTTINNDIVEDDLGFFAVPVLSGGETTDAGATVRGTSGEFVNQDLLGEFFNYIDVGLTGEAQRLSETSVTLPPTLIGPDVVASEGTFAGSSGEIVWRVESSIENGGQTMINTITFESPTEFGPLQFINYLDQDVFAVSDDLLQVLGTPGEDGFRIVILDNVERVGFSQSGGLEPGEYLINATFDGWAADVATELRNAIVGPNGAQYSIDGAVDTGSLPATIDPQLGDVFGLGNATSAFAWTLDPAATTATITTFFGLIPSNPATDGESLVGTIDLMDDQSINVPAGIGVQIDDNASPTLLNNIIASFDTGVTVDSTSGSTVVGGNLYKNNNTDTTGGVGLGDFAISLLINDLLFVNEVEENYYLAPGSQAIDSSIASLEDRPSLVDVQDPLGIPVSPILAPDRDITGQLRVDDPNVDTPAGFGEDVFKDRGALDRADFFGPAATIVNPLDNDSEGIDLNSEENVVQVNTQALDSFALQLVDGQSGADPFSGIGIDDGTVVPSTVTVTSNGVLLIDRVDYLFNYDTTNNIILLTPLAGFWQSGSVYLITLDNSEDTGIRDLASNPLRPNETTGATMFTILLGAQDQDFGDAPTLYPTLIGDNGATHVVVEGFYLGTSVDVEPDGLPSENADGDGADDDGVDFASDLRTGATTSISVTASQAGLLSSWIDFNDDGDWDDLGEQILTDESVVGGGNTFTFSIPESATVGTTYARFRLSTNGGLSSRGLASDGEVEDYQLSITSSTPWQNPVNRLDVNGDGFVSPIDALLVINELNNRVVSDPETGLLPDPPVPPNAPPGVPPGWLDVSGDGFAAPIDVLMVINFINEQADAEGESAVAVSRVEVLPNRDLPTSPGVNATPTKPDPNAHDRVYIAEVADSPDSQFGNLASSTVNRHDGLTPRGTLPHDLSVRFEAELGAIASDVAESRVSQRHQEKLTRIELVAELTDDIRKNI